MADQRWTSFSSFSAGMALMSNDMGADGGNRKRSARANAQGACPRRTLTSGDELIGFAQTWVAHFNPPQPLAARRRQEHRVVEDRPHRMPGRARQQGDGTVH